jgi:hypothetical protein
MDMDNAGRLMSAREDVLLWGLVDWVELERVHWYVSRTNSGQPLPIIQDKTLDLIWSLVSDGMFEIGELDDDCRFLAWNTPLDESMRRVRDVYVTNFDDQNTWPWFCWLAITEKGLQVAEAIEASAEHGDGS